MGGREAGKEKKGRGGTRKGKGRKGRDVAPNVESWMRQCVNTAVEVG